MQDSASSWVQTCME